MNRKHLLLTCLTVLLISVFSKTDIYAQDTSVLGRFSVENASGCAPFTVRVTPLDNFGPGTSRQYWYENKDNPPVLVSSYNYSIPGEYYLVQLVNANVPQKEDSIKITVIDPTPPEFEIYNCNNHIVRVEVTDTNYDRYRVNFTDTDFEIVEPGTISPEHDYGTQGDYTITVTGLFDGAADNCGVESKIATTIGQIVEPRLFSVEVNKESVTGSAFITFELGPELKYYLEASENDAIGFDELYELSGSNHNVLDLNTLNNYYCFRIRVFNACRNEFIYSETLCSVMIDVGIGNGVNNVTWNTEPGLSVAHKVIRNGDVQTQINDPFQLSYDDENILCGVEYCYEIQSIFNSGTSLSVDSCIVATKTGDLPPLDLPSSSIIDETVVINWPTPNDDVPLTQYLLQRSVSGRGYHTLAYSLENTFEDKRSFYRDQLSYRVLYEDNCGNRSIPSDPTSPIVLNIKDINSNVVEFEWNKYETWTNGIRTYFLERLDDSGALIEEYSVLSGRTKEISFSVLDDQPKNIRVRAESLDAPAQVTYSNIRKVEINPVLHLPTAFTPDSDGLNDSFEAKGPKVFNYKMQIFSRWGDAIFYSEDVRAGWDGLIKGKKAPEGTYIYRINFEDAAGNLYNQSGSVVLLRTQ